MPTITLPIGPPTTLVQSQVYALPARPTLYIHSTAAVEVSPDGTTWDALTLVETVGAACGSAFLRCTTGTPVVSIRSY